MNMYDWNYYIQQLQEANHWQQNQIKELNERIRELESLVQEKSSHTVEKIEYHFDQLKIERLDGTLHIGLSPGDLDNIDDLGLGNSNPYKVQTNHPNPINEQMRNELNQFLHHEGPNIIRNLANENNRTVNQESESLLIQDMEKQLPDRIKFYENEARKRRNSVSEEELKHYIVDHVKQEIYHSLTKYMQENQEKGDK